MHSDLVKGRLPARLRCVPDRRGTGIWEGRRAQKREKGGVRQLRMPHAAGAAAFFFGKALRGGKAGYAFLYKNENRRRKSPKSRPSS